MRLLAIHPGSEYAIGDVYDGLVPALSRAGVEVVPFALSVRLERAASWLRWCWQESGDPGPAPNDADVAYQAGIGAIERALRLKVDWVLVFSAMYFHPDVIVLLRRAGLKIGMILTESPYESEAELNLLKWAEIAWTIERSCVEKYRQINPNVFYLQHAYDPERHSPQTQVMDGVASGPSTTGDEIAPACHDVVFVGTPFPERVEMLEAIDWEGIDLGLYGWWDEVISDRSPLRAHVAGGVVPNTQAAALYRASKIGLNIFRSSKDFESGVRVEGAESVNPRVLELAACGVFQISDWRPEVEEIFGGSVPTFQTAAKLQMLLRKYLDRPDRRAVLAYEARLAVAGHTFDARAEQVIHDLEWANTSINTTAVA